MIKIRNDSIETKRREEQRPPEFRKFVLCSRTAGEFTLLMFRCSRILPNRRVCCLFVCLQVKANSAGLWDEALDLNPPHRTFNLFHFLHKTTKTVSYIKCQQRQTSTTLSNKEMSCELVRQFECPSEKGFSLVCSRRVDSAGNVIARRHGGRTDVVWSAPAS